MHCTACDGPLEAGFLRDFGTAQTFVSTWVEGEPQRRKSVWERMFSGDGVSTQDQRVKAIGAFRCTECGRLEL